MKTPCRLLIPATIAAVFVQFLQAQEINPTHATLSAYTQGRHLSHVLKISKISATGPCITVHYRDFEKPGGHRPAFVEYEEHISIPIQLLDTTNIRAVNQYGQILDAIFVWQGSLFESVPCPMENKASHPIITIFEEAFAEPVVNTSNRAIVGLYQPSITGFVLNEPSWVIIRGLSPSLPESLQRIADPKISLYGNQRLLEASASVSENKIENDDWMDLRDTKPFSLTAFGLDPPENTEAAIVTYLLPGSYTVHLESKGEYGTALTEVFLIPYNALPIR